MNVKYLIGAVIEAIIKVVVVAAIVMFVLRTSTEAYNFGYKVFADEPVSASGGRTITVGIAEDADIKDIAEMLEEKGLIEDAKLFIMQEFLSAYHKKIKPGIYDLNTSMTAEEMLSVMSTSQEAEEDDQSVEDDEESESIEEPDENAEMENTEGMAAE
ncbi:MAG: endolytic transglycosylase MltG [Lachnospiraceae bacterium]|nr:endolytic transglycosylase MltG [Lachnospiraceae bacterium]MBD5501681.1 endolytic transglycosylase MltG [Lachnospiraceae bacterium]